MNIRTILIPAVLLALPVAAAEQISGPIQMKDGDSAYVAGQEIRLQGVDAPEWAQLCTRDGVDWNAGQEATAWAQSFVGDGWASCSVETRDRYGRAVATCMVDGKNLNEAVVKSGWAFAYRYYSGRYVEAENDAKTARRGVWAGICQAPWDWRRNNRKK